MALPKSIRPEYSTTIPSTGKKIKYQPFSVKEEKVLVLAAESQDLDEIANAITNVLEACITSPADLKVSEHTDLIDISDDIKVKMKYPGIQFFTEGLKIDGYEESLKTVSKCISQIVIGEEVYNQVDMTEDEAEEWVEGLTTEQFSRILEFFKTMPKLKGLADFF